MATVVVASSDVGDAAALAVAAAAPWAWFWSIMQPLTVTTLAFNAP